MKKTGSFSESTFLIGRRTTWKPRNVKKYLLAALFNAPSTMGAFYQAEVNHDMAYGACEA